MRHFYQQVHPDPASARFYGICPICGNKLYAKKLPHFCRKAEIIRKLELGQCAPWRQSIYNHHKAGNVQYLARFFNLSRLHGKWICDDCFAPECREENE